MMPLRFGYLASSPCASWNDFWSWSSPYTVADQLELAVLRLGQLGLHHLDPGVLVGRVRRRRQDRDLAAVGADRLRDQLDLRLGDAVGGGLVDEHVAALGLGVRVVGDDLRAGGLGLGERAADRVLVVGRHHDDVGLLLRQRVDVATPAPTGSPRTGRSGVYVPLNSSTATLPPLLSEVSKYGLLTCLGRKATFRPSLMVPVALPGLSPVPEPASASPPSSAQAARASVSAASTAVATTRVRPESSWCGSFPSRG